MAETSRVVVVEKDSLLICISVEPFVLGLEINIGVSLSGVAGLAYSWWSPNPYPSDIFGDVGLGSGDAECIDSLFEGKVSVDTDKPLFHGLLCADFQQLLVLVRLGTLLVESGRLEAKFPRAFDACLFFVAIIIRSIINFNNLKMRVFAVFLQCRNGLFVFLLEIQEVLQVNGALLTFLELPCDILRPRIRMPLLEVLFTQGSVRVVVCT